VIRSDADTNANNLATTSNIMKTQTLKHLTLALAAGSGLLALTPAAPAAAARTATWRFEAADAAAPEVNAGFPGATAQVSPGQGGLGWMASFPDSSGAVGTHDLGNQGRVTADLASGSIIGPAQITVRVRQWFDGWIFSQLAAVAVPGATLSTASVGQMKPSTVGSWLVSENVFEVPAGAVVSRVEISSSTSGGVVDEVSVSTTAPLPEAPVLAIEVSAENPGEITLSWSETAGPATVESTGGLGPDAGWEALELEPQLVNGRYQVTVSSTDGARYFRLRR